jgi:hypothetical protein
VVQWRPLDEQVTLDGGETSTWAELIGQEAVAVVVLRHFGCTFCREHVADLRELPADRVVFVAMATPEEAAHFRTKMRSPHRFVCDPEAKIYDHVGLGRGTVGQMFGIKVWIRGAQAAVKGHGVGRPIGDPWRLSGTFIVSPRGQVTWAHQSRDASDLASPAMILEQLRQAVVGNV